MDAAIAIDDEVIAYLAETSLSVPTVDVGYCVVLALDGGRTVDDDFGDLSHSVKRFLRLNTNLTNRTNNTPITTQKTD